MDRSQLRNVISSGRAIALDCCAISKTIPADDPIGPLFKTSVLNNSVLLKQYQPTLSTARQPVFVTTSVYFPYDSQNPYDGGESLDFSDVGFHNALSLKISQDRPTPELLEQLEFDMGVLKLINSMHSLDPFMFKSKVEQQDAGDNIHDAYFALSPEEWGKIEALIREKILGLVTKAFNSPGEGDGNPERTQYVEHILTKIWEAKDVQGIESFIQSMQIEHTRAPELFFAWKAVCYYQVHFTDSLDALKTMFQWAGHDQLCFPVDYFTLGREELQKLEEARAILRHKMRAAYVAVHKVLSEYEHSYNEFIMNEHPQAFISFLNKAENSYLLLANHVSVTTHSVNLWKWYVEKHGAKLRTAQFKELFEGLSMLYGVEQMSSMEARDGSLQRYHEDMHSVA